MLACDIRCSRTAANGQQSCIVQVAQAVQHWDHWIHRQAVEHYRESASWLASKESFYGENRHGCDALTNITSTYLRYQIRKSFVVDQRL